MMKSENSSSNALFREGMGPWIRELTRRYWAIPALGTVIMLLISAVPVAVCYHKYEVVAPYMGGFMQAGIFFPLLLAVLAIASSAAVFSWLHRTDSALAYSVMPAGRERLYAASIITGLIMCLIPILITGAVLLGLSGASPSRIFVKSSIPNWDDTLITLPHIGSWLVTSMAVILFVFGVSALAAVITGKTLIHVLMTVFLNAAPAAVTAITFFYPATFWKGFDQPTDVFFRIVFRLSPITYLMRWTGYLTGQRALALGIYAGVALILLLAGALLLKVEKFERIGDACTFTWAAELTVLALTYLGMSLVTILLTENLFEAKDRFPIAFIPIAIASGAFFWIICRMIADGTFRVFNGRNFLKFILCGAVIGACVTCLVLDLPGYQKRVPEADAVASVTLRTDLAESQEMKLTSPETIRDVTEVHRACAGAPEVSDSSHEDQGQIWLQLDYTLKDGKKVYRNYQVPVKTLSREDQAKFAALAESEEFREKDQIPMPDGNGSGWYEIYILSRDGADSTGSDSQAHWLENPSHARGLIRAANQDMKTWTFEDRMERMDSVSTIYFSVTSHGVGHSIEVKITADDTHILNYLKENGYPRADRIVQER